MDAVVRVVRMFSPGRASEPTTATRRGLGPHRAGGRDAGPFPRRRCATRSPLSPEKDVVIHVGRWLPIFLNKPTKATRSGASSPEFQLDPGWGFRALRGRWERRHWHRHELLDHFLESGRSILDVERRDGGRCGGWDRGRRRRRRRGGCCRRCGGGLSHRPSPVQAVALAPDSKTARRRYMVDLENVVEIALHDLAITITV